MTSVASGVALYAVGGSGFDPELGSYTSAASSGSRQSQISNPNRLSFDAFSGESLNGPSLSAIADTPSVFGGSEISENGRSGSGASRPKSPSFTQLYEVTMNWDTNESALLWKLRWVRRVCCNPAIISVSESFSSLSFPVFVPLVRRWIEHHTKTNWFTLDQLLGLDLSGFASEFGMDVAAIASLVLKLSTEAQAAVSTALQNSGKGDLIPMFGGLLTAFTKARVFLRKVEEKYGRLDNPQALLAFRRVGAALNLPGLGNIQGLHSDVAIYFGNGAAIVCKTDGGTNSQGDPIAIVGLFAGSAKDALANAQGIHDAGGLGLQLVGSLSDGGVLSVLAGMFAAKMLDGVSLKLDHLSAMGTYNSASRLFTGNCNNVSGQILMFKSDVGAFTSSQLRTKEKIGLSGGITGWMYGLQGGVRGF